MTCRPSLTLWLVVLIAGYSHAFVSDTGARGHVTSRGAGTHSGGQTTNYPVPLDTVKHFVHGMMDDGTSRGQLFVMLMRGLLSSRSRTRHETATTSEAPRTTTEAATTPPPPADSRTSYLDPRLFCGCVNDNQRSAPRKSHVFSRPSVGVSGDRGHTLLSDAPEPRSHSGLHSNFVSRSRNGPDSTFVSRSKNRLDSTFVSRSRNGLDSALGSRLRNGLDSALGSRSRNGLDSIYMSLPVLSKRFAPWPGAGQLPPLPFNIPKDLKSPVDGFPPPPPSPMQNWQQDVQAEPNAPSSPCVPSPCKAKMPRGPSGMVKVIVGHCRISAIPVLIEPRMTVRTALSSAATRLSQSDCQQPDLTDFMTDFEPSRTFVMLTELAGHTIDSEHVWNVTVEDGNSQVLSSGPCLPTRLLFLPGYALTLQYTKV